MSARSNKVDFIRKKFGRRILRGSVLLLNLQFLMRAECFALRQENGKMEPGKKKWLAFFFQDSLFYFMSTLPSTKEASSVPSTFFRHVIGNHSKDLQASNCTKSVN